jgi:hypothetical protein
MSFQLHRLFSVKWEDDDKRGIGKDVEGSGHGLLRYYPALVWRD